MVGHNQVTKALIPVAGLGTRMLPATKAVPKELLPVLDKPIIQHIVEEAVHAGIKDIVFITRQGKKSIEDHFDDNYELETILKNSNKINILKEFPKNKLKGVSFTSVRQKKPLGLGHAIFSAKKILKKDEPFAVFLPDEFLYSKNKTDDFKNMMKNFNNSKTGQILVEKVKNSEVSNYGIVDLNKKKIQPSKPQKIFNFVEKPLLKNSPSNYRIVGRYILPYDMMTFISKIKPGKNNEIQLTDALQKSVESKKNEYFAILSESKIFDCGSVRGFLGANLVLANEDAKLKKYLKEIII